jgi:hypothetical protein
MAEVHRRNAAALDRILAAHGWPGTRLAGDDGAEAAWLVAQHAIGDVAFQRRALAALRDAAAAGDASWKHVAFLTDRIRVAEGRVQVYGTQHDWNAAGELAPLPIDDPNGVEARRRSVGLEPLAEHTARLRARAAAEGERAPRG